MNDIVIYPSKGKMVLVAIGSLFMIAAGIFIAWLRESVILCLPLPIVVITTYIGVPFFGLTFIYSFYRLIAPIPAVMVNPEGILDNASLAGAGMLKWEEIREVFTYDFMGQRYLGIVPVDVKAVIARQPSLKRLLSRMNKGITKTPFNIASNILPMSVDELATQIQQYRAQLPRNHV